jgi:protein tyrosine/serine phosphatase
MDVNETLTARLASLAMGLALAVGGLALATSVALADEQPSPDLSGITIENFHVVDSQRVYRGARPSADGIAELAGIGVKTVLTLETYALEPWDKGDEQQAALASGLQFLRIEMNPLPYPEPTLDQIQQAVAILADPANQPVFVHCYHGSDRTGIVVGAYRILDDGWTADQAIAEVDAIGHSSFLYDYWDNLLYKIQP